MWQWLYNLIDDCPWCRRGSEHCDHADAIVRRWQEKDTLMVEITCPECGFHDLGPVYADPYWVEHLP